MTKPAPFLAGSTAALLSLALAASPALGQAQGSHQGMDMPPSNPADVPPSGSANVPNSGTTDMSTTTATPVTAASYLQMASSGDQFEIQSSQLALQMSRDPTLRSFAQMLINDHTSLSNSLADAARTAGLAAPAPTLSAKHSQMLDALRAAGTNFDSTYRQQQVLAHAEALGLHRSYSTSGDVAGLRTAAAAAVPVIERHLQQAQTMTPGSSPQPAQPPASTPSGSTTETSEPTPQQRAGERG